MDFQYKINKSLLISKYKPEARYIHLCGYVPICLASMCVNTHMCMYTLCALNYLYIRNRFKLYNSV